MPIPFSLNRNRQHPRPCVLAELRAASQLINRSDGRLGPRNRGIAMVKLELLAGLLVLITILAAPRRSA